jgi:hypothetical protein
MTRNWVGARVRVKVQLGEVRSRSLYSNRRGKWAAVVEVQTLKKPAISQPGSCREYLAWLPTTAVWCVGFPLISKLNIVDCLSSLDG